ncbi:HPP family protein [Sorangium sp. So ce542]|uniref:HPP family protein n=1 Tax=Sorangium sp. So ce542 TaxID=3133316 RepID=UPI003F5FE747
MSGIPEADCLAPRFHAFFQSVSRRHRPWTEFGESGVVSLGRVAAPSHRMLFAAAGAAFFILTLGLLDPLTRGAVSWPALMPPFGASTVIVFFAPETPASRPWNIIVGHVGSAMMALLALHVLPGSPVAVQAACAVSAASLWMVTTKSLHPPGGATALLGVITGATPFAMLPLALGCIALVSIRWLIDRAAVRMAPRKGALAGLPEPVPAVTRSVGAGLADLESTLPS